MKLNMRQYLKVHFNSSLSRLIWQHCTFLWN